MRHKVRHFVIAIHNHQPVGNFSSVFEKASEKSYAPFLKILEENPWLKVSLHYSGCLLEWMEKNLPEFFIRIQKLVERGQVELLGGGMYEPIFSMLSVDDLVGHVRTMNEYVYEHFGVTPKGVWIPERVWEQWYVSVLADLGIEYCFLDDFHFLAAGAAHTDLNQPFRTEDKGKTMVLFPGREELRYSIPYKPPQDTIQFLVSQPEGSVVCYADDGEKFGLWPKTHEHVWQKGWMDSFVRELKGVQEKVSNVTAAEALKGAGKTRKIYIGNHSYREMGEWSLLYDAQQDLHSLLSRQDIGHLLWQNRQFIPGGYWRNFKSKYPELEWVYGRITDISSRLHAVKGNPPWLKPARAALYRAQCNCAHWHGVFGGCYLPHLRAAVQQNILAAEKDLLKGITTEQRDIDLDGSPEAVISSKHVGIYIKPSDGGTIVEFSVRKVRDNLMNVLTRKREVYHSWIPEEGEVVKDAVSIHDINISKTANVRSFLEYDAFRAASFRDSISIAKQGKEGLFAGSAFSFKETSQSGGRGFALAAESEGIVLTKKFLVPEDDTELEVFYTIESKGKQAELVHSVELNFGGLSTSFPESFVHVGDLIPLISLEKGGTFEGKQFGIVDNVKMCTLMVTTVQPCKFTFKPCFSVSQSEEGFEAIWQHLRITCDFHVTLKDGKYTNSITLQLNQL